MSIGVDIKVFALIQFLITAAICVPGAYSATERAVVDLRLFQLRKRSFMEQCPVVK